MALAEAFEIVAAGGVSQGTLGGAGAGTLSKSSTSARSAWGGLSSVSSFAFKGRGTSGGQAAAEMGGGPEIADVPVIDGW
jgi:hypothetical protein